jgi:hypothetical protein
MGEDKQLHVEGLLVPENPPEEKFFLAEQSRASPSGCHAVAVSSSPMAAETIVASPLPSHAL